MAVIAVDRIRFKTDWETQERGSRESPDKQLQSYLQKIVDLGSTVISVQQTECVRAQPGALDTYIRWTEFLIITSHSESW